jgi:hypothetical protein
MDAKSEAAIAGKSPAIPIGIKLALVMFLALFVPVYWRTYGPANFLWACDLALILTTIGVWLENSLLISICALAVLVPQCVWTADYAGRLLGIHACMLTNYMFDPKLPLAARALSLFHAWLPLLLMWLLQRLGYNRRALPVVIWLAAALLLASCIFASSANSADGGSDNANLNFVHHLGNWHLEKWMGVRCYPVFWWAILCVGMFLPVHLALGALFRKSN